MSRMNWERARQRDLVRSRGYEPISETKYKQRAALVRQGKCATCGKGSVYGNLLKKNKKGRLVHSQGCPRKDV